jgi:hypothetical protein
LIIESPKISYTILNHILPVAALRSGILRETKPKLKVIKWQK